MLAQPHPHAPPIWQQPTASPSALTSPHPLPHCTKHKHRHKYARQTHYVSSLRQAPGEHDLGSTQWGVRSTPARGALLCVTTAAHTVVCHCCRPHHTATHTLSLCWQEYHSSLYLVQVSLAREGHMAGREGAQSDHALLSRALPSRLLPTAPHATVTRPSGIVLLNLNTPHVYASGTRPNTTRQI